MGGRLCVLLCHKISDDNNLKKENQGKFCDILKRKKEMEAEEKKVPIPNLTLEDWILASPGLKPEYIIRSGEVSSSSSKSKKKVHPCMIAEAKDSLCLDRPMNRTNEEAEQVLSSTSIGRKRVSFKLPHSVIFYLPDEPCLPEEPCYYSSESDGSFYSSICREYSFDSCAEEHFIRLAVDVLPQVFVSSKI